ncbi:glycosyltransferase family 87 protein, partial [Bdellovibrionota bacterium FG-2]
MEEVEQERTAELLRSETLIPLFLASLIAAVGTSWAFTRGTSDFPVFYESWRLVLAGRGAELYHATPDRFLYAPGFAWILSPLGLLPKDIALAIWCFAKAAVIGFSLRALSHGFGRARYRIPLALPAWAVVFTARPILIDFQYGQVNTFLLGACVWALAAHFDSRASNVQRISAWFVLGMWAAAKLIIFPLFLVPIFSYSKGRSDRELIAAFLGVGVLLLLPWVG